MSCLSRRGDDLGVVAIGKYRASPARAGLAPANRCVEMLGGRDLEALHPQGQCLLVLGLDEQVEMAALNADMHDPKVVAPRRGEGGFADGAIGDPAPQVADYANDAQNHVNRM